VDKYINDLPKYVLRLVCAAAIIALVFPLLPGITFTGDLGAVIGITLAEYAVSLLLILAAVIAGLIAAIIFGYTERKKLITLLERLGYYRVTAISIAAMVFVDAVSLKIVSTMASTLAIAGFLPAILAAAALYLAGVPGMIIDRRPGGKKAFEAKLAELRAQDRGEGPPATEQPDISITASVSDASDHATDGEAAAPEPEATTGAAAGPAATRNPTSEPAAAPSQPAHPQGSDDRSAK